MASETATKRVTGEAWVDLEAGEPKTIAIENSGSKTVVIVVDTSAPAADAYLENAMVMKPGCDPVYISIDDSDKIYGRVYSSIGSTKSTISWHEVDPPA